METPTQTTRKERNVVSWTIRDSGMQIREIRPVLREFRKTIDISLIQLAFLKI